MFIEGDLTDEAYNKRLNPIVYTDGITKYVKPDMEKSFIYDSNLQSAIKLPVSYRTIGRKTPLIILGHGMSSEISATTWGGTDLTNLVTQFVNEGFAVIDVNQITAQDWCNPALIKQYVKAINNAIEKYNVEPRIIYGESMGSLIGLRLSTLYSTVGCCVISGIRLDLEARYDLLTAAQQAIVDSNLGFTNGYDADIAAGWDVTACSCIDANDNKICPTQFPPTFFVVGSTDTTTKTESLAKIEEIKRGGTICKTVEYVGTHNDVCFLKPTGCFDDVIEWINLWA